MKHRSIARRRTWAGSGVRYRACVAATGSLLVLGSLLAGAEEGNAMQVTTMRIRVDTRHSHFEIAGNGSGGVDKFLKPAELHDISGSKAGELIFERHAAAVNRPRVTDCSFTLWWPKESAPRALYLYSLHSGSPSLSFCLTNGLAAVGFKGDAVQRGVIPASVLLDALKQLGEKAGHPELPRMPFLVYGFSNGSGAATALAMQCPDQVVAWVADHPGGDWPLRVIGLERVPGMVTHGMADGWFTGHGQERLVRRLREQTAAPINLAIRPSAGHSASDGIVHAFFRAMLELRKPRRMADGSFTMDSIVLEDGYLGQPYDKAKGGVQELKIVQYRAFDGDRRQMDWLPDKAFAELWARNARDE